MCEHGKQRRTCKLCIGYTLCEHGRNKYSCKECGGASRCKEHNRLRRTCKECKGSGICEHKKIRAICKICDPMGHFIQSMRSRTSSAFKGFGKKSKKTIELLGCDWEVAKKHVEEQFLPGMSWKNHGEWHIDHIEPLKYDDMGRIEITKDLIVKRCHYTNLQPLWAPDNCAKCNYWIG